MKFPSCVVGIIFFAWSASFSQVNPNFNVNLHLDYTAAEQTIQLFEDQLFDTQGLSELKGNIVTASTTGLISDRGSVSSHLRDYLDSLKQHQIIKDDIYHLEKGRQDAAEIKELLGEIKKRNFNRRVVATVEQIFPQDARVRVDIPVYVVALGHENVDAFVRRIIWQGDTPQFVGEGKGELTIVVNLSHAVNYGTSLEERFITLLGVVAHVVFHAAFGAYKETSSLWQAFYGKNNGFIDDLLDLTHNEGIAYYLSLDQRGRGYVPRDWDNRTREAMVSFNKNCEELLSYQVTQRRAQELLRTANLSGYWDSYGSMTGMFIAREIDLRLGRVTLIETIANGPVDFFKKYIELTQKDSNLPVLSKRIKKHLSEQ